MAGGSSEEHRRPKKKAKLLLQEGGFSSNHADRRRIRELEDELLRLKVEYANKDGELLRSKVEYAKQVGRNKELEVENAVLLLRLSEAGSISLERGDRITALDAELIQTKLEKAKLEWRLSGSAQNDALIKELRSLTEKVSVLESRLSESAGKVCDFFVCVMLLLTLFFFSKITKSPKIPRKSF